MATRLAFVWKMERRWFTACPLRDYFRDDPRFAELIRKVEQSKMD